MADMAVHLKRNVLPAVPVRHGIGSLPWGLRALLGYDRTLCSEVVSAFVGELSGSLRRRAKRLLSLGSVADAHTGAVASVQRTDSALRLNVHAHVMALDGVYAREAEDGPLVFRALPTPTRAEVADVARRTAERVEYILKGHGRSLDPQTQDAEPPALALDEPGLALVSRSVREHDPRDDPRRSGAPRWNAASHPARDRYSRAHRPADPARWVAPEGRNVWKDGTRALVLEPHDLLTRLVAAVPPPKFGSPPG